MILRTAKVASSFANWTLRIGFLKKKGCQFITSCLSKSLFICASYRETQHIQKEKKERKKKERKKKKKKKTKKRRGGGERKMSEGQEGQPSKALHIHNSHERRAEKKKKKQSRRLKMKKKKGRKKRQETYRGGERNAMVGRP